MCAPMNFASLSIGVPILIVPQITIKISSAIGTSVEGITDPRILNVLILWLHRSTWARAVAILAVNWILLY